MYWLFRVVATAILFSLAQTFIFQRIPRGTLTRLFDGDKKTANATTPEPGTPPSAVLRSTLTGKGILLPRGGAAGFVETKRLWPVQKQGRWTPPPLRRRDLTAGDEESSGVIFSSDFKALRRSPRDRWRVREGSGRDKMPENAPSSLDETVRTEKESFGGSRRGLRREGGGSRSSSGSYRRSHGGSGSRPSSSASLSSSSAASEHGPPPLATLTIQYNYLAESSLSMIEVWPIIKFNKPQHYLTRWWVNAKRWGLLCDELLELEQELSAVSSRSASRGADSADFPDKGEGFEDEGGEKEEDEEVEDEDDDEGEGVDEDGVADLRGEEPEDHEGQSSYSREYGSSSGRSNSGSRNRPMPSSSSFSSQPWPGRRPPHPPRATRNSLPKGLQARLVDYCRGRKARVIVIGDVHGCVTELSDLLRACCYSPGDLVLLLGDLVAKGPHSIECIRLAMSIGAVSVRGNHDQEVVRQAIKFRRRLGVGAVEVPPEAIDANSSSLLTGRDKARSSNFTTGTGGGGGGGGGGEHFQIALQLSPREFTWMSELPYFIRSDDLASLFVHAGFQPSLRLRDQDPWAMMTMRSLLPGGKVTTRCDYRYPWADHWVGPLTVFFGHDAARGLQAKSSAVGIDTGCVYGGRLTAMLLPDRELVSVPARRTYQDMRRSRSHRAYSSSSTDSDEPAAMAEGAMEGEGEKDDADSSRDEELNTFGLRGGDGN